LLELFTFAYPPTSNLHFVGCALQLLQELGGTELNKQITYFEFLSVRAFILRPYAVVSYLNLRGVVFVMMKGSKVQTQGVELVYVHHK
jgi:hypothetical protein